MKKTIYMLVAGAALLCASCDDHDSPAPWVPGEESTAAGIYFGTTDNLLSVTVGEDTHLSIPVNRLYEEGDLSVPLVVESECDKLVIPASVDFADGQTSSAIVVDLADVPTKQLFGLKITFPDEYINPYAAGPSVFDGSVLVSDWENVSAEPVTLQFLDWSYNETNVIDPMPHEVQYLPGTTRYRIRNFLNSEIDFAFDVKESPYAVWKGYFRMMPLANQVMYSEYDWSGYYNPWWLVIDEETWPELEVTGFGGQAVTLYAPSFMWYDDEYENEYCYIRIAGTNDAYGNTAKKNFAYMAFYAFYDENWDLGSYTGYLRIYFEFPAIQ